MYVYVYIYIYICAYIYTYVPNVHKTSAYTHTDVHTLMHTITYSTDFELQQCMEVAWSFTLQGHFGGAYIRRVHTLGSHLASKCSAMPFSRSILSVVLMPGHDDPFLRGWSVNRFVNKVVNRL